MATVSPLSADTFDGMRAEFERLQDNPNRSARRMWQLHMRDVVVGKIDEPHPVGVLSDLPELSEHHLCVWTLGGVIMRKSEVPAYRPSCPVSKEAVALDRKDTVGDAWAVVSLGKTVLAMSIEEAYRRGLRETPTLLARLRALMSEHGLTRGDIARMIGLEPRPGGSHGTVDMWPSGARNIPVSKLELIELKAPTRIGRT